MAKPRLAADYDDDITAASRSALAEVMTTLGAYRDALVLIGGWAPSLILERFGESGAFQGDAFQADAFQAGPVHVGSIDDGRRVGESARTSEAPAHSSASRATAMSIMRVLPLEAAHGGDPFWIDPEGRSGLDMVLFSHENSVDG